MLCWNAGLAWAWHAGQRVRYWREEPLEVDGIIDGSWNTWALEIKTSPFESAELRGLLEFCRRYPRYRPLVITAVGAEGLATRFGLMEQHYKHKQARVTATHGKYPNAQRAS